jgi:hypothetical protein
LEKWVVRNLHSDPILPPVGSWPVCEVFIERALINFGAIRFEAVLRHALAVNPIGLGRQFKRKGRLARRVFDELLRLEGQATAALPFIRSLFEVAATRAIWVDRDVAVQALEVLDKLPASDLARAQMELAVMGRCNDQVPDVFIAALLLTALGARRFAEGAAWDWPAWWTFHALWTSWLERCGDSAFAPPALHHMITASVVRLYEAFFGAVDRLDQSARQFEVLRDVLEAANRPLLTREIPLGNEPPLGPWPAVFRCLLVLKGRSWYNMHRDGDCERVRRKVEEMAAAAKARVPLDADPNHLAYCDAFVASRRMKFETDAGGTLQCLEAMRAVVNTATQGIAHEPLAIWLRLHSITFIARRLRETNGDATLAHALAEEAELICKPVIARESCVEGVIWCWAYALSFADVVDHETFAAVMKRLHAHAEAFPDSASVRAGLASVLDKRIESLWERGNGPETESRILALTAQIEALAEEAPDVADVQWCRVRALSHTAQRWSSDANRGLKIEALARRAEAATRPFPDHFVKVNNLFIWKDYAYYESRHGVECGEAERIARYITKQAEPLKSGEGVAVVVVMAWEAAVYGWHRDPRYWASCERALRRLEASFAEEVSEVTTILLLRGWGSVLKVHERRRDFEAMARLEPEALGRVEIALSSRPESETIAEEAVYILSEVAFGRREGAGDRKGVGEMAAKIRTILARHPNAKTVQQNATFTEGLLRDPASNAYSFVVPWRGNGPSATI